MPSIALQPGDWFPRVAAVARLAVRFDAMGIVVVADRDTLSVVAALGGPADGVLEFELERREVSPAIWPVDAGPPSWTRAGHDLDRTRELDRRIVDAGFTSVLALRLGSAARETGVLWFCARVPDAFLGTDGEGLRPIADLVALMVEAPVMEHTVDARALAAPDDRLVEQPAAAEASRAGSANLETPLHPTGLSDEHARAAHADDAGLRPEFQPLGGWKTLDADAARGAAVNREVRLALEWGAHGDGARERVSVYQAALSPLRERDAKQVTVDAPAPGALPDPGLRLDAVERELVSRALERSNNNKSQAARLLGLPRGRLYTLIRRHGLTVRR